MKNRFKLLFAALSTLAVTSLTAQVPAYQNPQLLAAQRADDLLGRLTLEEKALLMMDTSPAIPRLGIPPFQWWNEALHGVGRNGIATVFPITMAMAASWDDALLHRVYTAVSDEARAKAQQAKRAGDIKRYQSLSFWTPNINIFRDPRWGRGQETYGEDPYLTGRMGLAVVRGLQGVGYHGEDLGISKYRKLLACAKHFAVHSGPEWNRHTFDIESLPERDLWETYLPAFKTLVQEGRVAEVMCAYQRIDGEACCAQHRYEQQILRNEWGFQGLITSDCGAIRDFLPQWHNVAKDAAEASAKAVLAGTDVECGSEYKNLPEAVRRGDIREADLDRSLRRLLIARFELGDFDSDELVAWTKIPASCIASAEHKALAYQMAQQSIVLLKNNGILPIVNSKSAGRKIVVMGPNANDSVMMWGNYNGQPTETTTILQGIRQYLPQVPFVQGCTWTRKEVPTSMFNRIFTDDGRPGLQANYWNNERMEGLPAMAIRLTEPLHLDNGGNTAFAPGVNLEHFAARYEGEFRPLQDGEVTLDILNDDYAMLVFNGDTLVNRRNGHGVRDAHATYQVKAGNCYPLLLVYAQSTGHAMLQFDITMTDHSPAAQSPLTAPKSPLKEAETVIFVGGIAPRLEGEEMKVSEPGFRGGDRTSIELPQVQRQWLAELKKAGKRIIFVNCSGSAIALTPESDMADAIIQAWYGGEKGGQAVADVLFGACNPSGKLPVTFYRSTDELPDFLDYRMQNRTYRYYQGKPLFPFGFGLSYTTFDISTPQYIDNKVRVTVSNTGRQDGTEVVQVYIRRQADTEGPLKTLRGYSRVSLKAGESRVVDIDLPRERFEGWDPQTNTMRVVPGRYELMVGSSSADHDLKKIQVDIP